MLILGIDPGTISCGYALVEFPSMEVHSIGAWQGEKDDVWIDRIIDIGGQAERWQARHPKPNLIGAESQYVGPNAKTSLIVSACMGAVVAKLGTYPDTSVTLVNNKRVKLACGRGDMTKDEVAEQMRTLFGVSKELPSDATDALAIAWAAGGCHEAR